MFDIKSLLQRKLMPPVGMPTATPMSPQPMSPQPTPPMPQATAQRVVDGYANASMPRFGRPGAIGITPAAMPAPMPPTDAPPPVAPPVAPPLTDLQKGENNLAAIAATPSVKQAGWKQALNFAFQGLEKVGDAYSGVKNDKPITWLGDAKKQRLLDSAKAQLLPLQEQDQREQAQKATDQKYRMGEQQIKNYDVDNVRQQDDLARKIKFDESRSIYWERKADQNDLKVAGDEELRQLRDKWMTDTRAEGKRRLDLVEKEMGNRNIRNTENNTTRSNIADRNNTTRTGIATVNADQRAESARARLTGMDVKAKQTAINGAVSAWMKQNTNATPEEIADIRNQLIEKYK